MSAYNLYTYCGNNPVNYADSNGTMPFLVITAAIRALSERWQSVLSPQDQAAMLLAGIGIRVAGGALLGLGVGAGLGMISGEQDKKLTETSD